MAATTMDYQDEAGWTVLGWACRKGDSTENMRVLLKAGADTRLLPPWGFTTRLDLIRSAGNSHEGIRLLEVSGGSEPEDIID